MSHCLPRPSTGRRRHPWALVLALGLIAAACSGAAQTPGQSGAADAPWRTTPMRDVATGAEFTIEGLAGKTVVIEPMAIWCVSCRQQQAEARVALSLLASTNVIYVSLDIEPNESEADLADYAAQHGFDWRFAVAPTTVARSLAVEFGDQILSPPSTPLIFIAPDGTIANRTIGHLLATDLAEQIRRAGL